MLQSQCIFFKKKNTCLSLPRPLPSSGNFDFSSRDLPLCPQWSYRNSEALSREPLEGQEDCLYLSVYVPEKLFDQRDVGEVRMCVSFQDNSPIETPWKPFFPVLQWKHYILPHC